MAASGVAVTVLTPNGRRQTVKVAPNTPLLQVKCLFKGFCFVGREGCVSSRVFSPESSRTLFLRVSLFG